VRNGCTKIYMPHEVGVVAVQNHGLGRVSHYRGAII
jgi:hypothetical protein